MITIRLALLACLSLALAAEGVAYQDGDVALTGTFVAPAGANAKVPAVLVVHEWWGHNAYAQRRARELADQGYAAFALDMYGTGLETTDPQQAGTWATPFYQDNALLLRRARAGLAVLRAQAEVDPQRVAAIGFCFGGTVCLQLARSGEDLKGVVSFHGGLKTGTPAQADTLKAAILVCHGGADPLVPPAEVAAFMEEMVAAKATWDLLVFGTALHAFTNPAASPESGLPIAYDAAAEAASFTRAKAFLGEVLK